jgi:hypothetical protein
MCLLRLWRHWRGPGRILTVSDVYGEPDKLAVLYERNRFYVYVDRYEFTWK